MIRNPLHGLVGAALLAAAASTSAQEVRLLENAELRSHASPAAPVVASRRAGHRVQLVELRAGWAQVRDGSTSAWLRASALETGPAGYAAAAALETGRRASGNQVVSLGVRTYPAPRLNRHALIIGVGAYQADPARKVEALPGVKHDLLNALVVARYLQVPIENITLLKDEAATRAGLATAMAELAARMNPGDRVFIYWAGHGSRYRDTAEGGACIESLVPFDLKDVSNRGLRDLGQADRRQGRQDARDVRRLPFGRSGRRVAQRGDAASTRHRGGRRLPGPFERAHEKLFVRRAGRGLECRRRRARGLGPGRTK